MKLRHKSLLSVLPITGFIIVFYGGSLFFVMTESFGGFNGNSEQIFKPFWQIIIDREIIAAFFLTLILTTVSTLISAVCGTALAVFLREGLRQSVVLKTLLQIPLAIPHLAVSMILLSLFAPSGIFARVFYLFGIIRTPSEFPVIVNDAYGIGIIFAYVLKETPFIALVILTVLTRVDDEFGDAARNLGASRWQRFRFVTLPFIAPAIVFSSLVVWFFVFGAFEVPFVLGRSYPTMLAVIAQRKFYETDLSERPEAFAIAILMTIAGIIFARYYLNKTKDFAGLDKTSII
ncbi:MAG: ABC transporter permease subunit [Pyrinomonadaceae bacterium]|nr:ABC transporter permease subunit [Pyrinomonadaceae bacterium]